MKKGQVTIFVIVGLMLIIIGVVLFTVLKPKQEVSTEEFSEAVPEEFKPIENFVTDCIHKTTIEGIKKLGAHGGYIDPINSIYVSPPLSYNLQKPTEAEAVTYTGSLQDLVPYYYHVPGKSSYKNYEFDGAMPSVEEMENQLEYYLAMHLPVCLGRYSSFAQQGIEISTPSGLYSTVRITDDKIEVFVTQPMIIKSDGATAKISKFQTVVRFPLLKYFGYALGFANVERVTAFTESFTKSLISYYSAVDPSKLPPFAGHNDQPYTVTWSKPKVEYDLNSLLVSYVPAIQIAGTKSFTPIELDPDDVSNAFFRSLIVNVTETDDLSNIDVTFIYPDRSLAVNVYPSSGSRIAPIKTITPSQQMIPGSQANDYRFYYDVAFPVIVEIRGYEPNTEIPEFSFIFAVESNLIENKAALLWELGYGSAEWDESNIQVNASMVDGSSLSADPSQNVTNTRPNTKSLFCDPETFISGDVTVSARDDFGRALEGVSVAYGCGNYDTCSVGDTSLDGSEAKWTGKLPLCTGGYLYLFKEGYSSKRLPLTTAEGAYAWVPSQTLKKARNLTATISKLEIQKVFTRDDRWVWNAGPTSLGNAQDIDSEMEQVIFTIEQADGDVGENPITNTLIFGKGGFDRAPVQLAPGRYKITATLIDYNTMTIPANCSMTCTKWVLGKCIGPNYYPDEIEMEASMWGGAEISMENGGTFELTANDLDTHKNIEFHVLKLPDLQKSIPAGACVEALDEMNKLADYSAQFMDELKPEFS